MYSGERSHVIEYLQAHGWAVTGNLVEGLFEAYGIDYTETEVSEKFEDSNTSRPGWGERGGATGSARSEA